MHGTFDDVEVSEVAPITQKKGGWTPERIEQLKKFWEAGLSASQIAAELGNVTRNAVIGKVHRLGLGGRPKSPRSSVPRPRKSRPVQHMMRASRPVSRQNAALADTFAAQTDAEVEVVELDVPMGQRKTLHELNEETCHWPVGNPQHADFYFCGGNSLKSLPYCAPHCRVAYQPANDRRRKPPKR